VAEYPNSYSKFAKTVAFAGGGAYVSAAFGITAAAIAALFMWSFAGDRLS
jgi:heme exporter protein D